MSDEKVADVLEEMAPDEAADLLAELPEDRSQELLNLMEHEEADDVRKLLAYPEDSAGGIMTTEFVAVRPDLTAEQAIAVLRETAARGRDDLLRLCDRQRRPPGGRLLAAGPGAGQAQTRRSTEFMHDRVVSVNLLDSQDEVAQAVAKYNLLAVPVVDDEGGCTASSPPTTRWTRSSRRRGRSACRACITEPSPTRLSRSP